MADETPAGPLSEADRKSIIREVVVQKQREALLGRLAAVIGSGDRDEADRREKQAKDAVKAAKKHGVEGPFITTAELDQAYQAHVQQLHRNLVEQQFREEAGEADIDTERLTSGIEALSSFDPHSLFS